MELEKVQAVVDEVGAGYFPIKLVQDITDAANRNDLSDDERFSRFNELIESLKQSKG